MRKRKAHQANPRSVPPEGSPVEPASLDKYPRLMVRAIVIAKLLQPLPEEAQEQLVAFMKKIVGAMRGKYR